MCKSKGRPRFPERGGREEEHCGKVQDPAKLSGQPGRWRVLVDKSARLSDTRRQARAQAGHVAARAKYSTTRPHPRSCDVPSSPSRRPARHSHAEKDVPIPSARLGSAAVKSEGAPREPAVGPSGRAAADAAACAGLSRLSTPPCQAVNRRTRPRPRPAYSLPSRCLLSLARSTRARRSSAHRENPTLSLGGGVAVELSAPRAPWDRQGCDRRSPTLHRGETGCGPPDDTAVSSFCFGIGFRVGRQAGEQNRDERIVSP